MKLYKLDQYFKIFISDSIHSWLVNGSQLSFDNLVQHWSYWYLACKSKQVLDSKPGDPFQQLFHENCSKNARPFLRVKIIVKCHCFLGSVAIVIRFLKLRPSNADGLHHGQLRVVLEHAILADDGHRGDCVDGHRRRWNNNKCDGDDADKLLKNILRFRKSNVNTQNFLEADRFQLVSMTRKLWSEYFTQDLSSKSIKSIQTLLYRTQLGPAISDCKIRYFIITVNICTLNGIIWDKTTIHMTQNSE